MGHHLSKNVGIGWSHHRSFPLQQMNSTGRNKCSVRQNALNTGEGAIHWSLPIFDPSGLIFQLRQPRCTELRHNCSTTGQWFYVILIDCASRATNKSPQSKKTKTIKQKKNQLSWIELYTIQPKK